jgi:hypothetical protein
MKTLILLLILLPVSAGANTFYYNNYGTYEGQAVSQGNSRFYYNYRGDYMGQAVDNTVPNPAPAYSPRIELAPIPGTYEGLTPPGIEMIGDPE